MNIKSNLILLIVIFLLFSCSNVENNILPKDYKLNEVKNVFIFPDNLTIYDIVSEDIILKEVENCVINCNGNFKPTLWINYKDLDKEKRTHILEVLQEKNEIQKEPELTNLMRGISSNNDIYFCGCYEEMTGLSNKNYDFYSEMYFLDAKNKRFYQFQHVN